VRQVVIEHACKGSIIVINCRMQPIPLKEDRGHEESEEE
jgi:hypothetical protein